MHVARVHNQDRWKALDKNFDLDVIVRDFIQFCDSFWTVGIYWVLWDLWMGETYF